MNASTIEAILLCRVDKWHNEFGHLCYPRELISLPLDVVEFLISDGVYAHHSTHIFGDDVGADLAAEDDTSTPLASDLNAQPPFLEVKQQIEDAVTKLGGIVVPKFTWSVPKDVIWLSPDRRLKCHDAEEVLLFLKSSDRVAHDICSPFDTESTETDMSHVLCLSKFFDLLPQEITQHFPQLTGQEQRIRQLCQDFFQLNIQSRFALNQYSFDVYITRSDKVKLLDFNAVCPTSSSLLFSWEELGMDVQQQSPIDMNSNDYQSIPVKLVSYEGGFMLGQTAAVSMPYDMVGCSLTEALETMQRSKQQEN